jgi:uncharacterized OB-fold protein/acyl dehydratase
MTNAGEAKTTPPLTEQLQAFVGREIGAPDLARDPVNEAMIRQWCEALGDRNPAYTDADAARASVHAGIVAPPTMLQAWILPGIEMARPMAEQRQDLQKTLHQLLDAAGYSAVVATDCEQEYHRYLTPGDRVSATTVIESISPEKATALGIGYFIDTRTTFRDQTGDTVGAMRFRVLKFKPHQRPAPVQSTAAPSKPTRPRPPIGHDNAWWWEAITRGELLIQRCTDCGRLRHPPRPMCGQCQSTRWDSVPASGKGTVYSYVVVHHPQFPGFEYPSVAAVIELAEGTRLVSNVVGVDPAAVHIGMSVQASIEAVDETLKLPLFRLASV